MIESITFRCRPGAQFHFGKIAFDENTSLDDTSPIMHSDSLASAFVDAAFRVLSDKAARQILADFESGAVRVSSLYWQLDLPSGQSVYFLPKPVSFETVDSPQKEEKETPKDCKNAADRKDVLRARYISKSVWEAGILPNDWTEKCVVLQREFVLTREEAKGLSAEVAKKLKLYHTVSFPKVAVHKLTRENSLYHQTNVQIANPADYGLPGASVHFYFILESKDANARDRICNLACIIADEGIGGERSVGCGVLEGAEKPQLFQVAPERQSKGLFCSASLISPASQDELDAFKAWKIITRGGRRTATDGQLRRLKMLAEGAILRTKVNGTAHKISLEAAQYEYKRFGLAVCLPAHDHHEPINTVES